MESNISKKYICIFGGGAIRGFSYLGAFDALMELGIDIKGFAGSSVGAVFAAFASLGYNAAELRDVFAEVNFDLFKDIQINLAKNFAISKGEFFLEWIRSGIEKKYYGSDYVKGKNNPVTFKDIDADLTVITSNINGCTPYLFSRYTTPDFEVAKAVKVSTALPGLLEPFDYGENLLIDGDMMKSWPMWRISNNLCPDEYRILEFRLEGGKNWSKVNNSIEFLNAVFCTLSNFATDYIKSVYSPKDKFDYIAIDTDKVLPVEFTLPPEKRQKLIEVGYNTTMKYFTQTLVEKKKTLLPHYQIILDNLIKIKNLLSDRKISDAKNQLCELFVHLCESKRFIDSQIYDDIVKFKNYFFANLQKSFFFNRFELKDSRQVDFYLNKLNVDVLNKCIELDDYIKEFENNTKIKLVP